MPETAEIETLEDFDNLSPEEKEAWSKDAVSRALAGEDVFGKNQNYVLTVSALSRSAALAKAGAQFYAEETDSEVLTLFVDLLTDVVDNVEETIVTVVTELADRLVADDPEASEDYRKALAQLKR